MDKNAIKKYAVWARRELITRVSQKALQYGITENHTVPSDATDINGTVLTSEEIKQRQILIERIDQQGYQQVIEEVAYTWFNRFSALRFMEVNGYLPSHVRTFTDEDNNFRPQIITEAIHIDLAGLDMEKVYTFKEQNDNEGLFKYLIITQCNALGAVMPRMFEKISDHTELLFPDNLLREGSVIQRMIAMIPEEDWKDAVQIIGWLYQYYNSEKKDEVFAALKKNVKITKENIPAATQLFTPDWIVRYMVENSLGRLWLEGHPDAKEQLLPTQEEQSAYAAGNRDEEDTKWHYYLEEAEQEADVQAQLDEIRKEYASITPEQIKCIDPCCGSGHILAYMFDVLMQIYTSYGYTAREAVHSIVVNNICGLDIDERAAQLAYFVVMMKARQYDRRFLTRKDEDDNPNVAQPKVFEIVESNKINRASLKYFGWSMDDTERETAHTQLVDLLDAMHDAKEYGSILILKKYDWQLLYRYAGTVDYSGQLDFDAYNLEATRDELMLLIQIAATLTQEYDVVVTNPPYMGASGMSTNLSQYVKKHYPNSKSDLFAVMIECCGDMTKKNGYQAMITQHAWMFLSSFEKMRSKLLNVDIVNMTHLGARAFEEIGGEVVQTTSFVIRKSYVASYKGKYCRLIEPTTQQSKEDMFLAGENRYETDKSNFSKIPGSPVAYWISGNYLKVFAQKNMSDFGASCIGMRTGDNERFLRFWYEISKNKFGLGFLNAVVAKESKKKWFPYCKGGTFRKWYGNNEYVVNWENDGFEIKENTRKAYPYLGDNLGWKISNEQFYFQKGLTWSGVGAKKFGIRSYPQGMIFDSGANSYFVSTDENYLYFAGLLNCVIIDNIINIINPTINTGCGVIAQLPAIANFNRKNEIEKSVEKCIEISKYDWDSFETSWDFQRHPLVPSSREKQEQLSSQFAESRMEKFGLLAWHYAKWEETCEARFNQLKSNEEELNRIFIDIYGLQDELTPEVEDKDVTVRKADFGRDIRSFISYAVGCMFGRYSLDEEGLVFAGGKWDDGKYVSFAADADNIIPICDDEYFDDDIVGRFVRFVEVVYGAEKLEENLQFIADALGGSGQSREVIRKYFMNDFYTDHCKMYQKRPIYWLFDSGKKGGFRALVYMHRYQADVLARMRTDYVHEQQSRYRTAIGDLEQRVASAAAGERVKLNRRLKLLREQASEIQVYEEKVHHLADQYISIDLDDGVKRNYALFKDVVAKIK